MFFAFISSSVSSYSWGWPIVASIGGIIVFAGLLLEKIAERKNEKCSPPFFKPLKCLGEWGWRFLMLGILVEIGVGFALAAKDEIDQKRTAKEIANADPRNMPIVSILGRVRVEVRPPSTNFAANLHLRPLYANPNMPLSDDEELRKERTASFQFGKHLDEDFDSKIPVVGWIGSIRYFDGVSKTNDGNIRFDLYFDSSKSGAPVWNPDDITFHQLKSVTFWVSNEWPPPTSVVGGQIDLLVNGFWPKTFLIQPQTNQSFPYRVITTNVLQTPEK